MGSPDSHVDSHGGDTLGDAVESMDERHALHERERTPGVSVNGHHRDF